MGLDLFHFKACLTPEKEENYFIASNHLNNPHYSEVFSKYVTTKYLPEPVKSLYIIRDDRALGTLMFSEFAKDWNEEDVFVGDYNELKDTEIKDWEERLNLRKHKTQLFTVRDNYLSEKLKTDISYQTKVFYEYQPEKVFYYREVGYQRKGMQLAFYDAFENGRCYFTKEDVVRAAAYITPEPAELHQQLIKNFEQNFIQSFVEGESVFYLSW